MHPAKHSFVLGHPAQAAWARPGDEEISAGPRVRSLLQNVRPDIFETMEGMKDRELWRSHSRWEETEKTWERSATCGSPDQRHLGTRGECRVFHQHSHFRPTESEAAFQQNPSDACAHFSKFKRMARALDGQFQALSESLQENFVKGQMSTSFPRSAALDAPWWSLQFSILRNSHGWFWYEATFRNPQALNSIVICILVSDQNGVPSIWASKHRLDSQANHHHDTYPESQDMTPNYSPVQRWNVNKYCRFTFQEFSRRVKWIWKLLFKRLFVQTSYSFQSLFGREFNQI